MGTRSALQDRPRVSASPRQRVSPARQVAYDVVRAVSGSDAYANLLLPGRVAAATLSPADAGLATELCYGTLRLSGYYDRVIALAAGRDIAAIDAPVLDALRLGVHQLLGMRVAPYAAVKESVALAARGSSQKAAAFTNAVLRTVSRSSAQEWRERVGSAAASRDERISALSSHPVWIVRALRRALAAEGAVDELDAVLASDNVAPRVNLVALPGLAERGELGGAQLNRFSPVGVVSAGGDPEALSAVHEGRARVQDEGSQLAALTLARARPVRAGERWLDLCAGPGGKAAVLAAEARGTGATLVANEVSPTRAALVRKALAAVDPGVEVRVGDGRDLGNEHPGVFDRILLDAPCTGLGALRRRPEARWRKAVSDVETLAALQGELLDSAMRALAPDGLLAYVTCSPHLGETRRVLALAQDRHPLDLVDTPAVLRAITTEPLPLPEGLRHVQLWPHRHGTDALFIQLLRRA
ncbi:rRNA small subunit methyltransferase B [Rathayibacter toxicus]|nr:methyltransferase [Rathayibacter toxicus]QOD11484.1 rRNA small subunit methyltransferase B [Rathayibacter toxicus]QWL27991.1 rRNA small subunit methyltransferase B [Rathayibacter toxicus]QWL32189.1 rRNA small subunit methyltransferase B [Rathayibacter toxicus]QWL34282.1 rRNA small subunit methyltransferase B [Rathayibacter toxicus]